MRPFLARFARSLAPLAAAVLVIAAAGCGQGARSSPAPLDRFTYPTGLALVPIDGGRPALAVVSSNYDLRYSTDLGGSVLVVDPDRSSGPALKILGAAQIGSFGGEVGLLSGADAGGVPATCAGWPGSRQLLVPSRNQDALYRLDLTASGALTCGDGCKVGLDPALADAYGVQVACRTTSTGTLDAVAYVSHLRSPRNRGWLSKIQLQDGAVSVIDLGDAPPHTFAWDAARARLYVTGRFGVIDLAPLRWLEPAFDVPGLAPLVHVQNFGLQVRGAELRSMALSADGRRGYIAVRVFDRDLVTTAGVRAPDLAGALAIVDLTEGPLGPQARLLQLVPIGVGPNVVAVLPRAAGDLVAVSNTDEGTVVLYDDATGGIAAVLGGVAAPTLPGTPPDIQAEHKPLFGKQSFGLVFGPADDPAKARLYVGSFDRGMVVAVDVDLADPSNVTFARRFGQEMPAP